MKKIFLLAALTFIGCATGTNEYGNVPADQETLDNNRSCLAGAPAGLTICDDRNLVQWEIHNSSDTAIQLACEVTARAFVFIDKFYIIAGGNSYADSRNMAVGDEVSCGVWKGYIEGPLNRLFKDKPDYEFCFTYSHAQTILLNCNDKWEVADLKLDPLKGISCELGVQYRIEGDKITPREDGSDLYCKNGSSDWVDVQLFQMQPVTGGTEVKFSFIGQDAMELSKMSLYFDKDDLADVASPISQGQVYALVVRAHDWSNGTWSISDVELFQVDLLGKKIKDLDENTISGEIP